MKKVELDDTKVEIKETGYGIGCKEIPTVIKYKDKDEENTLCFCKVLESPAKKSPSYYIKVDTYTVLFDPYAQFKTQQETKASGRTSPNFQYKKVDKECFELYKKYLKTRNRAYYVHCDRLFKNKG